MNIKYQVFVSSTKKDLEKARQEVIEILPSLDCIPVGMEFFPATANDQMSYIKRMIDTSDFIILLVAGNYGYVMENGTSFTEAEFDYAIEQGKPVLVFLQDENEIKSSYAEKEPERQERMKNFREKVSKERLCHIWKQSSDLIKPVVKSVKYIIDSGELSGWIRADESFSPEKENKLLNQINDLKEYIKNLEQQIQDSKPVNELQKYAFGNDRFTINYEKWCSGNNKWEAVTLSWDEIFTILAGDLLIRNCALQIVDRFADNLHSWLKQKGEFINYGSIEKINSDDLTKIISTIYSLGLIEQHQSPSFWLLTLKGKKYLLDMMAVKKTKDSDPSYSTLANKVFDFSSE